MQIAIVLCAVTLIFKGVPEIINQAIAIIGTRERRGNLRDPTVISSLRSYIEYMP